MCMTLEMTYFRDELVQLTVSRSDSEQEVQRYGMKENTSTVDPIMLQDKLWMKQCEKPSPNRRSRFFENRVFGFEFWSRFGLVFSNQISEIFIGFRTPLATGDSYLSTMESCIGSSQAGSSLLCCTSSVVTLPAAAASITSSSVHSSQSNSTVFTTYQTCTRCSKMGNVFYFNGFNRFTLFNVGRRT